MKNTGKSSDTEPWAVLVTGSRKYPDSDPIHKRLKQYDPRRRGPIPILIHGAASGADEMAADYANGSGWMVIGMPAQWDRDGSSAGPKRNAEMLRVLVALGQCGYRIAVEAFPVIGSKGTRDMIDRAKSAALEVYITEPPE